MSRPAVQITAEFRRVESLPRRRLRRDEAEGHAAEWTRVLRRRGGSMALSPWQGIAITETIECQGYLGGLPVGFGKTLLLYCQTIATGAKRPVWIMRASLVEHAWSAINDLQRHWRALPHPLQIVSREILGRRGHEHDLDHLAPDFVGIDECDELSNLTTAGSAKRVDRYRVAHPEAVFACLTGTPERGRLMGIWHLLCWAHPRGGAPVPYVQREAEFWAAATDPSAYASIAAGPLGSGRAEAERWIRDRWAETPGVMMIDEDSCKAPLTIRHRLATEDPILDQAYNQFLQFDEAPGGEVVTDPLVRWGIDGRLGLGIYQYYDPPAPEDWKLARRAMAAFVRDRIERSQRSSRPLDTEGAVIRHYAEHPVIARWLEIKPTFKPITHVRWLTDSVVRTCLAWLAESDEPGVVWVGSPEFGERLAAKAGILYYGRRGMSAAGTYLGAAPRHRSLVASWVANKRGFDNLKHFDRHLITLCPSSSRDLEQLLGRAHRQGRDDGAHVDLLLTSGGTIDSFEAALGEADGVRRRATLTQKILRAEIHRLRPRLNQSNKFRWATRKKDK